MAWLSTIASISSYLLLPLTFIFKSLLIVLAPVIHLGSYFAAAALLPLKLLVKFETLYIYLGVAAIIGLITGSILYLSSSILVMVFDLNSAPADRNQSAASIRATKEQKELEGAWKSSLSKSGPDRWRSKPTEWQDLDRGKRRDDTGLLGQTIIEEDDDSDEY
ncbi:Uncharacterized protein BP5553_07046 [Venustampulla echinocandica]|uniref:Uncharacterized protein n=1 Tax=Venustampulla echinocandica TaxID=2656787 RepID=A0A370TIE7_9HELO|nr:Uncharacterized protein BP5553_07046 [Venustampulla echinocandica]RDL35115.1 Uncharacterized protein BP5553_07046 [Venustampulla echinocandica]